MAGKKHNADDDKAAPGVVRRRLVGAAVMLLAAFVLWHLGESSPPAQVRLSPPPPVEWQTPESEVLQDAETRLADGRDVLESMTTAEDAAEDASAAGDDVLDAVNVDDEVAGDASAIIPPTVATVASVEEKPLIKDNDDAINNNSANENTNETINQTSGLSFSAGVFGNPDNAAALATKIKTMGLQTSINIYQNDDGKTLHKVMVINLPDEDARAAAEKQLLEKPPPKESLPPSLFVVQVGAYNTSVKARDIADKLGDEGYRAEVSEVNRGGVLLHRVRAVGYQTRAAADDARRKLRALDYTDAQVIDLQ